MKRFFALLLAIVMPVLLLAGCGSQSVQEQPAAENGQAANLQTIVFSEPVRGYFWAPAYLAQTLGYFAEEGLNAEFQTVTGADASSPIFAGEAQFTLRGVEMALMANESGQGCKILVSTTQRYPYQLVGASDKYSTLESLRGGVVAGGHGVSSSPQAFSKACLVSGGLKLDEDVSVISMSSSGYAAAIKNGDIQAAVGTNPWSTKTLVDNGGVVIVDGADDAAMEKIMGSSSYELFAVIASDQYIASNPETVQKTVNAIAKAIKWMNTATPEDIAKNLEPLFEGQHEELIYSAQVDKNGGIQNTTGYHTESGYQAALNLTKLSGGIKNDIPLNTTYDESFLDNAWKSIGK